MATNTLTRRATSAAERERQRTAEADRHADFDLNPTQYDFVFDDASKYVAYIGGLGSGKSYAGAVKALRYMTEHPGSLGTIGAPNYPQLRDSTMRSVFQIFPKALIRAFNKTDGILALRNGSEVLFRSMDDPDTRRGPNLAWYWLDEGPLCGYYAWQVMKGRLRQAEYPVQAWLTGTPHGEDEYFEDFEHEPKPGHRLYRASTRENEHNLPPTYIEDLGYTGKFALQEIEGLFVTFEGLVYEMHPSWHVGEWPAAVPGQPEARPVLRIGGVDWGYTNPAVALPIWVDGDDRAYVRDEFYQRQAGLAGVMAAIRDFTRQYSIQTWYCGPDEPEHISELNVMFGREHLQARAVAAVDDITPGIETVRRQMAMRSDSTTGLKLSARCAQTRAEIRTYSYPTVQANRRDPQEKPIKKYDHAMDALRYAVHTALGGKTRHRSLTNDQLQALTQRTPLSEIGGMTVRKRTF